MLRGLFRTSTNNTDNDTMKIIEDDKIILRSIDLNVLYGDNYGIKDINIMIPRNSVTSIIGPSGCGKSTLLRCFNRMNELLGAIVKGKVLFNNINIYY